jgi:Tfp pilus assembly protein FimT
MRGFGIIELIATLSIAFILAGMAMFNARAIYHPSRGGAEQLASFLKSARAKALATTSTYTIIPVSESEVITTFSTACSSTEQTEDPEMRLVLTDGARLANIDWSICYTSRGTSNSSAIIDVIDNYGSKQVQIVLGGGVRVL